MRGLLADLIGLTAQVQRLNVTWLDFQDKFETAPCMLLLVHANVAARAQQIAILHSLVDSRQIVLEISGWRLDRIERVKRL